MQGDGGVVVIQERQLLNTFSSERCEGIENTHELIHGRREWVCILWVTLSSIIGRGVGGGRDFGFRMV